MELRAYHDKDWEAVCELYLKAKPYELRGSCDLKAMKALNEDEDMTWLFVNSKVSLLWDGDLLVGFYGVQESEVTFFYVHPDDFRKGYGKQMIDKAVEEVGESIWVKVTANNFRAISLFEQRGFKVFNEYSGVYNGYAISYKEMAIKEKS